RPNPRSQDQPSHLPGGAYDSTSDYSFLVANGTPSFLHLLFWTRICNLFDLASVKYHAVLLKYTDILRFTTNSATVFFYSFLYSDNAAKHTPLATALSCPSSPLILPLFDSVWHPSALRQENK